MRTLDFHRAFYREQSFLVALLAFSLTSLSLVYVARGHPLCLDSEPPFVPTGGLDFCSEYSKLGCCDRDDDARISSHYRDVIGNVTNATCAAYLKTILCLECSPLAVHIYDAETSTVRKAFPGLCRNYCGDVYRTCPDIVRYVTNSTNVLNALRSGESSFCSAIAITDMKYCYPDVLNDPEFNPNATQVYSNTEGCICLRKFAQSLRNPVLLLSPDDGSGRIFVGEQLGLVTIYYKNGKRKGQFLDLSSAVLESASPGDERGFLGMVFHPNFKITQKFYVYYSISHSGGQYNRVSEFRISANNKDMADGTSERVILEMHDPFSNHNGGEMFFGLDDNYLYISTGDGGSGGDPYNNAQNLSSLLGKILRVDVDQTGSGTAYAIPPSNPFIDTPRARPEVYAYGCRNMWRCSVDTGDPKTGYGRGRIFCGDVGQAKWEEVDIIKRGVNYGWNTREGPECYNNDPRCGRIGPEELPIFAYNHSVGNCIIGGYVYRGCMNPNLQGLYFFADYGYGKLFRLRETTQNQWEAKQVFTCGRDVCFNDLTPDFERNILSFGQDFDNELYFLTTSHPSTESYSGSIYLIVDPRRRGDPKECSEELEVPVINETRTTQPSTTSHSPGSTSASASTISRIMTPRTDANAGSSTTTTTSSSSLSSSPSSTSSPLSSSSSSASPSSSTSLRLRITPTNALRTTPRVSLPSTRANVPPISRPTPVRVTPTRAATSGIPVPVTSSSPSSSISVTTTTGQLPTNWSWSCDFELPDGRSYWCNIVEASNDQFKWSLVTPNTLTGPAQAFSGRWFIDLDLETPGTQNDTAKIYLPSPPAAGVFCLSFHYHMNGSDVAELRVFRETAGIPVPETVWRKSEDGGDIWQFGQVTLRIESNQKIGFVGVRGNSDEGDVALDALMLVPNPCPDF